MADRQDHINKSFDQELQRMYGMIADMGGIVETQLAQATEAILTRDSSKAARVIEDDKKVDALELEVEQFVIRTLALRQPMAGDLRRVVSALKITGGLERIGDYSANVAKRSIVLSQAALPFSLTGIGRMALLVQENLKTVIDAVGEEDADKALLVWNSDQAIDDLYNTIFRELITYMMEDPRSITSCTHLLFIAKNLERIGDHATNIAETVYYAVKGEVISEMRPKGDMSAYAVVRGSDA